MKKQINCSRFGARAVLLLCKKALHNGVATNFNKIKELESLGFTIDHIVISESIECYITFNGERIDFNSVIELEALLNSIESLCNNISISNEVMDILSVHDSIVFTPITKVIADIPVTTDENEPIIIPAYLAVGMINQLPHRFKSTTYSITRLAGYNVNLCENGNLKVAGYIGNSSVFIKFLNDVIESYKLIEFTIIQENNPT